MDSSQSPRSSPKRTTLDLSPADSDDYNSAEDKSERPIGRGQAKLHPQPLLPSPVCLPSSDSREILFERTHLYFNGGLHFYTHPSVNVCALCKHFEVSFLFVKCAGALESLAVK